MSVDLGPPCYEVKLRRSQNDILPRGEELPPDDYFFMRFGVLKCIKNFVYWAEHGWQFYNYIHDDMHYVFVRVEPVLLLKEDSARVILDSMLRQYANISSQADLVQAISQIYKFVVSTERDFRKKLKGPKHMPIAVDIKMEIYQAINLEEEEDESEEEEDESEDELTEQTSGVSMDDYEIKITPASKEAVESLEKVKIEEGLDVGKVCAICYEEFLVGLEGIRMPCTHLYHRDCILEWLARSFACPLCRFEMPAAPSDDQPIP